MNRTGSGIAVGHDAAHVGREAAQMAMSSLDGAVPAFGFVFASPSLPLAACLAAVRAVAKGADVVGCSTAGEITERGLTHGGVSVMLIAGHSQHHVASANGVAASPEQAARELCRVFHGSMESARRKGLINATTLTLVDGLTGSGEKLIESIVASTSALHQVVGGAAGDEGKFSATQVGEGERAGTDMAIAVHVFDKSPWGVGVGHGLEPTTAKMLVTKAQGNVVSEIDGRPAFSVYQEHAQKRGVALSPATAGPYMIGNELGILVGGKVTKARAPLSVGKDGSLSCAAAVPQGAHVAILDGQPDAMVAAARNAATEALKNLQGERAAGVLLFDCICRGMILKDGFQREIDAVREVMGDVPVAGFLTYGEIASYSGGVESWHNSTAVAVAIPR